LRLLRQV